MIYIKLDENMDLTITVNESIRRGENISKKITYLIPVKVGGVDTLSAVPYLCYVRADGTADIIRLDSTGEMYKDQYLQYTIPVTCKMTKYPGELCTWIEVFSGTPSKPTIAKSSECLLYVEDSKNVDDCLCDHQLAAIYQMQKQIDEKSGANTENGDVTPNISA